MSHVNIVEQTPVMDVLPWPRGRGFSGGKNWWQYVLSKEERRRLDNLMGIALLDEDVRDRLVKHRDRSLLDAFGICEETQSWLRSVQAGNLVELAQAIVSGPHSEPARLAATA